MSSSDVKHRKLRSSSAKETNQVKLKPLKTQTNYQSSHVYPKKVLRLNTSYGQSGMDKFMPKRVCKNREQLFQQNLQLKKKINRLQDELNIQRGQIQAEKKKTFHFTKKMQREFQKQLYWNGSHEHLITGIKTQYEKLKQQYEKKQKQCINLKKNIDYTSQQQYKIYAQVLEEQNRQLMKKLDSMISNNYLQKNRSQTEYMLAEKNLLQERLQKKNQLLKNKIQNLSRLSQQKQKKILFLEKLLIERDNNQYYAQRKAKKLEKQRTVLDKKIADLEHKLSQKQVYHNEQMIKTKQLLSRKINLQHQTFEKVLVQKQDRIMKLQKEVAYLSTLLTYWKPLDEIKNIAMHNQQSNMQSSSLHLQREDTMKVSNQSKKLIPSLNIRNSNRGSPVLQSIQYDENQLNINNINIRENRKPMTADKRNTENAVKLRKLQLRQINEFSIDLKYKLIGYKVDDIKQYFTFDGEDPWKRQYINMGEVRQILQSQPFDMKPQNAQLLSRYLVEDCEEQHVYCDDVNQLQRVIVKSRIRAYIGQYKLPNYEQCELQWQKIYNKYKANLKSAFSSIAPSGYIHGEKFLQLIYSLGIELSDGCKEAILGKIMVSSQRFDKMHYQIFLT